MYSSKSLGKGQSWREKSSLLPPNSRCGFSNNLEPGQANESRISRTEKKVAITTDRKVNIASIVNILVTDPLARARKNDREVQRVAIDKVKKLGARDTSSNLEKGSEAHNNRLCDRKALVNCPASFSTAMIYPSTSYFRSF